MTLPAQRASELGELRRDNHALREDNDALRTRVEVAERHLEALARDATDRVAAVEALRRNEALFRAVIEKSSEFISLTASDGTTRYLTPSIWRTLGWSPDDVGGRTMRDQVVPDDRARIATELARLARTGHRDWATEVRVLHRDGSPRWIESTATNLLDDPDVQAIVGNHRDITARRLADDALRASRDELEEAQRTAHLGNWSVGLDANDEITWSTESYRIFGVPIGTAVTKSMFLESMDPAGRDGLVRGLDAVIAHGGSYDLEHRIRRPDGTFRWVLTRIQLDRDSTGRPARIFGIVHDVTDRHDATETLRASEERYRRIVESTAEGIWTYDDQGITTFMNARMAEMLGYSVEEAIGQPIFTFMDESQRAAAQERTQRRLQGIAERTDFRLRRKDGSELWASIQANPLFDAAGRYDGVIALLMDLTETRRAEAAHRHTEEQFRQAQKMEAVGRLAGGVAHDFNNLLTVILSYSQFGLEDLKPGDPLRDDMLQIDEAARRATELTKQLLAFSRQQVLQPRVLDLAQIVQPMDRMLRRLLGEDVTLAMVIDPDLGRVLADPGQIEQIVMNLAVNARDAMRDGGDLTIELSEAHVDLDLDLDHAGGSAGVPPGDYVVLAVRDTGVGMDAPTQLRIFEPFFTTKEQGKGTGLGLSTVFGIVQQSGGHVGVDSELGHGATFKVYLPRTDQVADSTRADRRPTILRGTETILLVEDEEQVRIVTCAILRRNGYRVLETSNGGEALLVSRSFAGKIDLLLTDVVMPRMSGRKLAEELGPLRPDMRVVYASGYTDDAIVHHGVLDAGAGFVQKPFMPDTLLRKIREALDAGSPG